MDNLKEVTQRYHDGLLHHTEYQTELVRIIAREFSKDDLNKLATALENAP
jgi:hypothetical protein